MITVSRFWRWALDADHQLYIEHKGSTFPLSVIYSTLSIVVMGQHLDNVRLPTCPAEDIIQKIEAAIKDGRINPDQPLLFTRLIDNKLHRYHMKLSHGVLKVIT